MISVFRVREITRHYDQTVWDIEEPFHVTYVELTELNKERVEYLYEADSFGCLTECVCQLCPWHEWQQRKKKWSRHKIYKNEEPRKRWQFLTSDIIPLLISKSLEPEVQKPKRLNVTEINSSKMNGHHTNSRVSFLLFNYTLYCVFKFKHIFFRKLIIMGLIKLLNLHVNIVIMMD